MDTLEKVANAIGNDPGYFQTTAAGLDTKASIAYTNSELLKKSDLSTTTALLNDRYSKSKSDGLISLRVTQVDFNNQIVILINSLNNYQTVACNAALLDTKISRSEAVNHYSL